MLKLIKTVGGSNGSPLECGKCGSKHFSRSGIAWHCTVCGNYHPTALGMDKIVEYLEYAYKYKNFDKFVSKDIKK